MDMIVTYGLAVDSESSGVVKMKVGGMKVAVVVSWFPTQCGHCKHSL